MQSRFPPPFFHSDKLGRGVTLSNLPVIRRSWCTHPDCCTTLLSRQVLDLLSLFLSFSHYLSWCHFSSPELASLPRISVEKRICIIYEGIFQLLSNLSHLVILLFHLLFCVSFLLFTYLPPRDSLCCSEWFAPLISPPRVILTLPPSLSTSVSVSLAMFHREPLSLPLNRCVVCPLKTWEHFFVQTARSDQLAGGTSGGLFVSSLTPHVAAPVAELPGSRATMAGSENVLWIDQRYRCRLNQMAVRCEDGGLQHCQILKIIEPEMLIPLSCKPLPLH